jgi:predicted secreted hydrolase
MRNGLIILSGVAAVAALYIWSSRGSDSNEAAATVSVSTALESDTTGYRRADRIVPFRLPDDHGAHPDFKTEWWYFTGNLSSPDGRPFGFQFTIFRTALVPPGDRLSGGAGSGSRLPVGSAAAGEDERSSPGSLEPPDEPGSRTEMPAAGDEAAGRGPGHGAPASSGAPVSGNAAADEAGVGSSTEADVGMNAAGPDEKTAPESAWRSRQLYTGHLALSDIAGGRFYSTEVNEREGASLAGSEDMPGRIWLRDWEIVIVDEPDTSFELYGRGEGFSIRLVLEPSKPVVLQGDRGLSPKSFDETNASYYYSYTRMAARGRVEFDGQDVAVSGSAWMDHEWSTSALAPDQVGWDWFSVQFDDQNELMLFQVRSGDEGRRPFVEAKLIRPDGTPLRLDSSDVVVRVLDTWESPHSAARYPSEWRLELMPLARTFRILPLLADQEMNLAVRYWEGAVQVQDDGGTRVGQGYVELTGY